MALSKNAKAIIAACLMYGLFAHYFRAPVAGILAGWAYAYGACANHLTRHLDVAFSTIFFPLILIAAIRAFGMPVLGFSGLVGAGIVVWVGGNRVLADQMQVGHLATFTALLISLVMILTGLAWVLAAVSRGFVSLARVEGVLGTPPDLPEPKRELELQILSAVVECSDKRFLPTRLANMDRGRVRDRMRAIKRAMATNTDIREGGEG